MASENSQFYNFGDQMSAASAGYSGQLASPYGQDGSWPTDAYVGSYAGMSSYTTQIQQKPYRPPHHRQPQPKKQPSQPQILYCEICRVSCAGPQPFADHLNGQKHKKKETAHALQEKLNQCPKPAKASSSTTSPLYCELCDVACGSADTFAAHVRGVKHVRVLNLHTKLGMPVPTVTIPQAPLPPVPATTSTSTVSSAPSAPGMKQEAEKPKPSPNAVPAEATEKAGTETTSADTIEIVGQEYIEEMRNEKGLVVSYSCKLCECSFTDPNAKRVHLKGRRHRLQYKKKIDSTIEVEVKTNLRIQKLREERNKKQQAKESYWRQQDHILGMSMDMNFDQGDFDSWNQPRYMTGPRHNNQYDRYVISKHMDLYPPKEEMAEVHSAIVLFENALKLVSDAIADEDDPVKTMNSCETSQTTELNAKIEKTEVDPMEKMAADEHVQEVERKVVSLMSSVVETGATEAADGEASRRIRGAMRVGLLSKGVLMRGDLYEHLIIICSEKPTRTLLQRIVDHLPAQLEIVSPERKYKIETRFEEAGLFVTIDEPPASFAVTLTSMLMTEDQEPVSTVADDQLSPVHCLSALALLRHSKWFQVRLCAMNAGTVLAHVLRDFCRRNLVWAPLSEWAQELLVEKCIFTAGIDIGPGEALRSFFECISSGILLPGGNGLIDPCEKIPTDVTANLTAQQSEDITSSAQRFMRLVVYRQIYKVLDVPQFKHTSVFKRRRDPDERPDNVQDEKKLKEDGALQNNGSNITTEGPLLTSIEPNSMGDPFLS